MSVHSHPIDGGTDMKLPHFARLPVVLCAVLATLALTRAADPTPIETLRFADANGNVLALDHPGVLYLVDVWALGCSPCMAEMPELERLAQDYEPDGRFRLVSVVSGGWKGKRLKAIARDVETTLPIYSDPNNWLGRLDIHSFPTKFLIRDGMLLRRTVGGGTGAYRKWSNILDNELESPSNGAQP
jgi:thiol-disulfide isomerase/thioredoxin